MRLVNDDNIGFGLNLGHALHVLAAAQEVTQAMTLYGKNAIVWANSDMVGSFVTPRDETLRNFVREAKMDDLEYFIIEGFDQPWKAEFEGGVGAYWGVWDGNRHLKPALQGVLVNYENWRWLAAATIALPSSMVQQAGFST